MGEGVIDFFKIYFRFVKISKVGQNFSKNNMFRRNFLLFGQNVFQAGVVPEAPLPEYPPPPVLESCMTLTLDDANLKLYFF